MPVLMVATYDENGTVDVMNLAWGGICARNMVSLKINENHKTSKNIKIHGAFTLSIADAAHMEAADFFGMASGNTMPDKFARSGLSAVKSEKVDAPVVQEFPLTLECRAFETVKKAVAFLTKELRLDCAHKFHTCEAICIFTRKGYATSVRR